MISVNLEKNILRKNPPCFQKALVSLVVGAVLSSAYGFALADSGMHMTYVKSSSIDPNCQSSMNLYVGVDPTNPDGSQYKVIAPGDTVESGDLKNFVTLPSPGDNNVYFSMQVTPTNEPLGSNGQQVCPNSSSGNNPTVKGLGLKVNAPDFLYTMPNPVFTIEYQGCSKDASGNYYPTFSCSFSGFTGGAAPQNQIIPSKIPDMTINVGASYNWKQNPILDFGNYFQDTTSPDLNPNYKNPEHRIYYSVSINNPSTANSTTTLTGSSTASNRPLGLEFGPGIQFSIGGQADYRSMLSTQQIAVGTPTNNANLIVIPSDITKYCQQPTGKTYYQCQINVCACDPLLNNVKGATGSCIPNGSTTSVVNDSGTLTTPSQNMQGLDNFTCPSTNNTGAGPVQTSFNLYVISPFRGATVQEMANANVGNPNNPATTPVEKGADSFSGMTRLIVPINPTATPTSQIPLGQYFRQENQTNSGLEPIPSDNSVTYTIVGLNSTPAQIPMWPNKLQGSLPGNNKEPLLSESTAASDWSPIKIIPGVDTASNTPEYTPTQDNVALSINNGNLSVNTNGFKPTDGGIYQLTIEAKNAQGDTAYQTIYLNISNQNTSEYDSSGTSSNGGAVSYTPMKAFNSMWMYLPGFTYNPSMPPVNPSNKPNETSNGVMQANLPTSNQACTTAPSGNSQKDQASTDPCVTYSDTLHQLDTAGTPIQYLTPDMMWLAFDGSVKVFPSPGANGYTTSPMSNNFFTDNGMHIQSVLDYFHQYNPNIGIILTSEMDNPVMGSLATLQDTLTPDMTAGKDFTQLDRLVFATVLPFITTQAQGNAGPVGATTASYGYNNLLAGLQFDVEPFKNAPEAVQYYKRVADILARHGKLFEMFGFADATMPLANINGENLPTSSVTMAMGPLGVFQPSMYDVGNNTDPTYAKQYIANFMPGDGTTARPYLIDNNCHWSADLTDSYINQGNNYLESAAFPVQSYCNVNLTDTIFNNASLMGLYQPQVSGGGQGNGYFTEMMATYGGHFQMAVPSAGSAENFTAQMVINPVCAKNIETGNSGNFDDSLVNPDPYSSSAILGGNACPPITSEDPKGSVNVIAGLPSNYVYGGAVPTEISSALNAPDGSGNINITDSKLNSIMPLLQKDLKAGYYYIGTDQYCINQQGGGKFTPDPKYPNETYQEACRYLLFLSNLNNEGSSVSNFFYPGATGSVTSTNTTSSQDTYLQALIAFANGQFDSEFKTAPVGSVEPNPSPDIGTPMNNPNNLGLALYALSSEQVTGCFVNESHALKPGCLLALPVTTTLYDPNGVAGPLPGQSYWISNLSMTDVSTTSYKLNWTLNCVGTPTLPAAFDAIAITRDPISGNHNLTIFQQITPKACGEQESATFPAPSTKHPINPTDNVSLFLTDDHSWQAVTNTLTVSPQGISNINPFWKTAYQYTNTVAIQNLSVTAASTQSYTLSWTLNCNGTPPAYLDAISITTDPSSGNHLLTIFTQVTPKACGETETATFKAPTGHPITLGAKASLFLTDVYSWQAVTNTLETTLPTTTLK